MSTAATGIDGSTPRKVDLEARYRDLQELREEVARQQAQLLRMLPVHSEKH